MRTDLIVSIIVAAACAFLAVVGFFLLDWSPVLCGALIALMLAADGYVLWALMQQLKKPPVP